MVVLVLVVSVIEPLLSKLPPVIILSFKATLFAVNPKGMLPLAWNDKGSVIVNLLDICVVPPWFCSATSRGDLIQI